MGFWGLSDAGKEAGGFPREYGAWSADQFKNWLGKSQQSWEQGGVDRATAGDYFRNRLYEYPTVGEMQATGREIMPGVDDALARRRDRLNQSMNLYGQLTKPAETIGNINTNLDTAGRGINENTAAMKDLAYGGYDEAKTRELGTNAKLVDLVNSGAIKLTDLQNLTDAQVNDLVERNYGTQKAREEMNTQDIMKLLDTGYGSLIKRVEDTYGGLEKKAGDLYGEGRGGLDTAYTDANKTLELIRPGGEAAAARAARAYAPAASATLMRMRKAGIDPNSPEAANAMRQVDVAKARGMDEALADATAGYVDRKTGLTLGKQDKVQNLMDTLFARQAGLGTEKTGLTTGLGEANVAADVGEKRRSLGALQGLEGERAGALGEQALRSGAAKQGIEAGRTGALAGETLRSSGALTDLDMKKQAELMGITDQSFTRTQDWLGQKNNAELLKSSLERQDWATVNDLLKGFNDEEMTAIGLQLKQYEVGQDWQTRKLTEQDQTAMRIFGMSEQAYRNAMQAASQASSYGQQAMNAYGTAYDREAANAGWGKKALLGMAPGLLSLIPGVGPVLGPLAGAAMSGASGGAGGGVGGVNLQDLIYSLTGKGKSTPFDFSQYGVTPYSGGIGGY